jgi:hypothetical protein
MRLLPIVLIAACGPRPPTRTPAERTADAALAVTALRDARFADAEREATTALIADPSNSQAAAVRAIAVYQQAGSALAVEIQAIVDHGVKGLDHGRGRRAWAELETKLAAVDRDLAVVADDPGFALELCLACWEHDWNRDGTIDERDRRFFEIEVDAAGDPLPDGDPRRRPTFRFDVGDADWARAMVAFQRAAVDLILAYRWNVLDDMFKGHQTRFVIPLLDRDGVRRARELVLDGVRFADRSREAYLAETDDDREWVPNPRQKNHPVPLVVDDALYQTWAGVTGDVRRLVAGDEGVSLRELGALIDRKLGLLMPDAYIDVGAMLRDPSDIVLDVDEHGRSERDMIDHVLRGLLGHGYRDRMKASPLPGRLHRMREDIVRGDESLGKKLRYLLWLN